MAVNFQKLQDNRRSKLDGDGLVDGRKLRGDRLNVGGLRADDPIDQAEAWAALDNTFHYGLIAYHDQPEGNTTVLRTLHKDQEKPNYSKDPIIAQPGGRDQYGDVRYFDSDGCEVVIF